MALIDSHGDLMGYYIPTGYDKSAKAVLKQCSIYLDERKRIDLARKFEVAGIHNMRANLRYYQKKRDQKELDQIVQRLTQYIDEIEVAKSVDEMMLVEARARQDYYSAFNFILRQREFRFTKRTRRPPEDALNAMISFGNTLLYNAAYREIIKTSLDVRIGAVHAANRRNYSLNLDFADIFKPIIVDRVIFSLINCMQIKVEEHFEEKEGGIYLNQEGKRLFLEEFEEKMRDVLVVRGKKFTYRKLLEHEIYAYQRFVMEGSSYRPYKYY